MARLTPRDIQEKEFSSGFRGYKEEDVDEFLDRVTASYEEIFKENIDLKEEVDHLVEENKKYELIGERMQAALVAAQETADDVRKNATKEAENILREAEIKAHKLVQASRDQHRELQKSLAVVKQVEEEFRFKLKSTLQSYLKLLDEVALGDSKEIKKWILPEDMSVLDERRREMEGRESAKAAPKQPEAPVMAAETGIPGDVSEEIMPAAPPAAEAVEAKVPEAPVEAPKMEEAKPDDTAAMEAPAKPYSRKAAKEEAKKAEEAAAAAQAEEAKAKAAALMEEIAQQAAAAEREEEAKAVEAKAKKEEERPAEEAKPAAKAEFDADNAKASAVTPEWAKLQEAVAEAVKEAEKPKDQKAEAPKAEAKTEPKAEAAKAEANTEPKAEAKEAKTGKTNLDDIEIVEDESFWKDI